MQHLLPSVLLRGGSDWARSDRRGGWGAASQSTALTIRHPRPPCTVSVHDASSRGVGDRQPRSVLVRVSTPRSANGDGDDYVERTPSLNYGVGFLGKREGTTTAEMSMHLSKMHCNDI